MLRWLTGPSEAQRTAEQLYGRVVAAARQSRLYRDLRVPDTAEGRFEMIVLHLFFALEALRRDSKGVASDAPDELMRRTIETFITNMDDSMREQGVGDLTVPKKVKRAAAAFYERAGDYRAALPKADGELAALFAEHVWSGDAPAGSANALADYARAAAAAAALASDPAKMFANAAGASHPDGGTMP